MNLIPQGVIISRLGMHKPSWFHAKHFSLVIQDARLLGEIHVALLRTIIKDIEDVARTPSTNVGANLNSVANPGGGHPHIVEGVSYFLLVPIVVCIIIRSIASVKNLLHIH